MKTEDLITHFDDLETNYSQLEQMLNEEMCLRALRLSKERKAATIQQLNDAKAELEEQTLILKAAFGLGEE